MNYYHSSFKVIDKDLDTIGKAFQFAGYVDEFISANPPENIGQGIRNLVLGLSGVGAITLSVAVTVNDVNRLIEGKPLRSLPPRRKQRYRVNRLPVRKSHRLKKRRDS